MAVTPPADCDEPGLRIELVDRRDERCLIVHVAGEVDLATVGELAEALRRAGASRVPTVICDLRQVTFLAVTGLRCLGTAAREIEGLHGTLRLVVPEKPRLSALLVMDPALGQLLHRDVEEAVRSAYRPQGNGTGSQPGRR